MKKSIIAVIAVALVVGITNVNAMTKSELKAKIDAGVTINGVKYTPTADQKTQIDRYLDDEETVISTTDADKIAAQIDEAVKVLDAQKVTSLSKESLAKLPADVKTQLSGIVSTIEETTGLTIEINDDGIMNVKKGDTSIVKLGDSIVKKTNNNNIIVVSSLISVVGLAFVAKKFF